MTRLMEPNPRTGRKVARVLIVDDHPIVREGYAKLIGSQPDLEVCGDAADAGEALRLVETTKPDLIVIDISLKEGNGIELCKDIRFQYPQVKMLVASAHDEALYAERVLRAGATGYVNKEEAIDQLIEAIRLVLSGKIYLSDEMTERMLCRAVGSDDHAGESAVASLSDREIEVFEFIGHGMTTRQIAEKLDLSPKTIESYRENIKTKLNLKNGAELTQHAVRWVLESH
ncbi:MAG: response regulator transcription factor [Planctomycetaceae bacterium]